MLDVSKQSQQHSVAPVFFKRFCGGVLTVIGVIGSLLTSPLSLIGGTVGLVIGTITQRDITESGFIGAKIGSLGLINVMLFGIELLNTTIEVAETSKERLPLIANEAKVSETNPNQESVIKANEPPELAPEIKVRTAQSVDSFFTRTEPKLNELRSTQSHNFNHSEEIASFIDYVNEIVVQDELQAEPKIEEECLPQISEQFIATLITIIKNPTLAPHEFWDKLEQMSMEDIRLFVSKLSSIKEKGRYSSSELDYLWRQFNSFESEPTKRDHKSDKFAVVLGVLSDEQLKASFDSTDFLNILNKDYYVASAGNTLNRKQLALFASNSKRHEILNLMIKKLKPGAYLLGKLVSIIPYASGLIKGALIEQLAYLSHPASFKIELTKLAEHYIDINSKVSKRPAAVPPLTKAQSASLPLKWVPVKPVVRSVYTNIVVNKIDWTDEDFEVFINVLNAPTFIINEQKIIEDLNSLPDHRIKMIADRAASPAFNNLLKHYWIIESKLLNHKSYIDCRENRLKIILENLSESQLISSLADNKFWDIFRNTQEPYCQMAAAVLTPRQFEIIISKASLDRHSDFAVIITQIKKDTSTEKERLQKIIELIIPYTSPWLVLALELQIKSLLKIDKPLYERFKADLQKSLSESMEQLEVRLKYARDVKLNKKAISQLLNSPHDYTPAAGM